MSKSSICAQPRFSASRAAAAPSLAVLASLMLGACAGSGLELPDLAQSSATGAANGEIETSALAPATPAVPVTADATGNEKAAISKVKEPAVVAKARDLREAGDKTAALALLDEASDKNPDDRLLRRERGLLALDLGRIAEARTHLAAADDPANPDWRVKSALGAAHAASGDHTAADKEFAAALKLAPEHPSILNNMALSHALAGRHDEAEKMLRRVAAAKDGSGRAKQNLALILGLSGRVEEAREVSEAALPKQMAAANVSYLERLRSGGRVSRAKRDADTASDTTIGALDNRSR